jgi:hypothetical protein
LTLVLVFTVFEGELCDVNGGGDVDGAPDLFGGGVYALQNLPEVFGVCYEYFRTITP